ncbi:MAG TPA: hypothetical protein VIL85_04265 [Thermomicrobiales bacterium]|jgi:hypothetical protein
MGSHGQSGQQGQDEAQGDQTDPQEVARGTNAGEGNAAEQDTPPGGDVRTVYSNDRDPGDAEPAS